jgi:transposase
MIPNDFPPWDTVYHYYRKWQKDETWDQIHNELRQQVRLSNHKSATPSVSIIDSQSVKTVQKGVKEVTMRERKLKAANGI